MGPSGAPWVGGPGRGPISSSGGTGRVYFLGTYEHTVDERGRLAIPVRYRAALAPIVVLAKGPDGCLEVYTPQEFERKAGHLLAGATNRQRDRRLGRAFFGGAAEVEIDSQGRVLIPAPFRQWAGLTGPAVILGRGAFLELWSASRWEAEQAVVEDDFARALETMEPR